MQKGWISIHRSLIAWEWFQRPEMVQIWIYLLLKANHAPAQWQGIEIKRGQLVTSRPTISKDTGLTDRQIRTCLQKLIKTGEIQTRATNRFSIITICNYASYQDEDLKSDRQATDKTGKSDQQKSIKATDKKSPESIVNKGTDKTTIPKATDKKQEKRPTKCQKATNNNNDIKNNKINISENLKEVIEGFPEHLHPTKPNEVYQWEKDYQKLIKEGYNHFKIIEALKFAQNDSFWRSEVLNIRKLLMNKKEGIPYIKYFIEKGKTKETNIIEDWGK